MVEGKEDDREGNYRGERKEEKIGKDGDVERGRECVMDGMEEVLGERLRKKKCGKVKVQRMRGIEVGGRESERDRDKDKRPKK